MPIVIVEVIVLINCPSNVTSLEDQTILAVYFIEHVVLMRSEKVLYKNNILRDTLPIQRICNFRFDKQGLHHKGEQQKQQTVC